MNEPIRPAAGTSRPRPAPGPARPGARRRHDRTPSPGPAAGPDERAEGGARRCRPAPAGAGRTAFGTRATDQGVKMEIGLDYMQMRSHAQYIGLRWAGVLTLAAGILIAAMGIAYYGHFFALRAALADYPAHRDDTTLLGEDVAPAPASGRIVSARALLPGVSDAAIAELGFTPMPQEAAWPVGTQPPIQRLKVPKLGINMKQGGTPEDRRRSGVGKL